MIAGEDVKDFSGRLIIPKYTRLTAQLISELEFNSISEIEITDEDDTMSDYRKFNVDYEKVVALIGKNLSALVNDSIALDTSTLIYAIDSLLDKCKTDSQIFDVLYNLDTTDEAIYHHSVNVALISVTLGKWLGLKRKDLDLLALAGVIHDIGKIMIPARVLNKMGKLTDEEFTFLKSHVKLGYNVVKDQIMDGRVKAAVLYHHERCDGSGYPFGGKADSIPDFAKIIAIADVYDAMTSSRNYRSGHCPFDVIKMFHEDGLSKYDPHYIMTFLEHLVDAYSHSHVLLSDGREAEIIMINKQCLYKPIVKCGADYIDLNRASGLTISKVL